MSLSRRLLILLYSIAGTAIVASVASLYFLLVPYFFSFEEEAVKRDLDRVENALVQVLTTLHARARDWSARPDVRALVLNGETSTAPLLPEQHLGAMSLDRVGLLWESGKTRWLRGPLDPSALAGLHERFLDRACYSFWGVARVGDKPMMFALEPVGESCDAVFFGMALDPEIARELQGITRLPVELEPVEKGSAPGRRIAIERLDEGRVRGSFVIRDVADKPVVRGALELDRPLYQRAMQALCYTSLALLGITLAAVTFTWLRLRALVFQRLRRLHETVKSIAQGGDLSRQVVLGGNDELGELARDFNAMVNNIRAAQAELADAREQAESASRAKSLFLANMSHEIRTPMTAILGYTDLMRAGGLTPEEQRRYLEIIQQNGDALLALISDVLDLSRIEAGQVQVEHREFGLPALLEEVISTHELRAREKGLYLDLEYQSPVPDRIFTDPYRLRQILVNLVGNAIKFTHEGGVTLRVSWESGLQEFLHIAVRDTGVGIAPGALNDIFRPFSQVDVSRTREYGGSGLGLAIARQLARSLNGDVEASSDQQGSEFRMRIAALASANGRLSWPQRDISSPEPETPGKVTLSGHALLVEDNEVNRLFVKRVLESAGMSVLEAENGQQAVEAWDAGERPDLVVMDMQMPVMDGYEATRVLRGRGADMPILALTANVMASDRDDCLAAGCDRFIGKPVRVKDLLGICDRLLNGEH